MKKVIVLLITFILIIALLAACNNKGNQSIETGQEISEDKEKELRGVQISRKNEKIEIEEFSHSPFSGKAIPEELLQRVIMVSIENSSAARPQSGLNKAAIVYEFLVEGGITRFLALYWDNIPQKIGPIRSVRPYIIDIASEYNALLLHAGASPEGFIKLQDSKIKHLDQIYKGQYYWRDSERKRPHNLYSGRFKVEDYLDELTGQKYEDRFAWQGISLTNPEHANAKLIEIKYWGNYKVFYRYNKEENNYYRYINNTEEAHFTSSGEQIKVDNIIIQFTETHVKDDEGRLSIKLQGEGKALVFKDGMLEELYWHKDEAGITKFFKEEDKEIRLNPGKTWIQIVPESTEVKYTKGE